jgi:carboxymethylenebutenolidase
MTKLTASTVEFPSNGHMTTGYLSLPSSGSGPGVVVIQEWWGLVDHIRDVCDRLAAEGFVALAPDLFHGQTTSEPDEAGKLMMELDLEQAAKDMSGTVDYLLDHPATSGTQLGALGFCMGGGLVLVLAARSREKVGAVVPFYGLFKGDVPDLSGIRAKVLGHFAANDDSASPEKARELGQIIRDTAGAEVDIRIYPGTDHAFFNDDRPEVYDPEASQLAWSRTLEFLRANLTR